ncbi:MAG: type VI secretion system tip protein TssI/VgrG, partial [Planctomycetota bacterium]
EEITVDEHGRVKVQFHWDRDAPGDETASCWVRVSQGWAGKNWGAMFIPRHGQEVIVEFLEGDPDRPIITGRVYNGENGPPYDPRSHATMSTIKSNSSKGGEGFNEWRFEDKKDKEQIFVHAQRRMDVRVRGSEYETTYGSRHVRVGWEKDGDRGGDLDLFVRQNHNRHIEADTYIWYGEESGNVYTRIEGDFKSHVVLNSEHLVKETYSLQSADELHMVENTASFYTTNFIAHGTNGVDIRSDASLFLTGINGVEILADSDAKLAGGSVHIKGGSAVNIEASSGINLKCGGSFIAISSSGVHISGPIVGLNSGGSAGPAQGAEEAVEGEQLEEVEFEGPLDAVVADDGKPGSIGGTGTRSRTRPSFSEGPMVPMPPPPPPNTGPGRNESPGEECEEPRVISIEWVEDEVYCSEFANLRGDIANCPDQTTLPIEIVEDTDRSTYHQDDASISGNSYSYRWKVIDVVPTQCPQEHEDLDGKAEAERTADPLRVKFIPDLTKTRYTRNRAHYDMEVKDFVIELTEDLKFVKGWAGFAAQLGTHVPAGTGGEISPWRFGGGYRWVKKTGTRFHYWNGSSWVLITLSDNDLEATGFTVGFYKNGANYTCQYGGNWPEAFSPDWNIDAANHQQKIRQWVQSMHDKWTRKFDLKRKQCESTLDECCRYEIVANPTMTKQATFREGYLIVTVGNDNNVMRSNDSLFFIDDADIDMAAHEFGHHLGNPDEYAGAAIDTSLNGDGATNGIDYTSVMGRSNQPAKKRHFGTIAAHMKKMVKDQIGKTYDYDVEPHTP